MAERLWWVLGSVCVVLAPDCAWCFYNRGLAEMELGRLDRARRDFDQALRLDPAFVRELHKTWDDPPPEEPG